MSLFSTPTTHVFLSSSTYCFWSFRHLATNWASLLCHMGTKDYLLQLDIWVRLLLMGPAVGSVIPKRKTGASSAGASTMTGPGSTHMPEDAERGISARRWSHCWAGREKIRKIFLGEEQKGTEGLWGLHPWRCQAQRTLSWVPTWPWTKAILCFSSSQEITSSLLMS